MKNKVSNLLLLVFLFLMFSCKNETKPITSVIIPQPNFLCINGDGTFTLSEHTAIIIDMPKGNKGEAIKWLANLPAKTEERANTTNTIYISLSDDSVKYTMAESYSLHITSDTIVIEARDASGLFYATRSLLQLYESSEDGKIIYQTINDYPRFAHRGLLLDVSRNRFDISFIKKQIDAMAYYKLNKLLWYVDSDSVSYSTADIKDVVDHAKAQFVEIIPVIELPFYLDKYGDINETELKYIVDQTVFAFSAKTIYVGNGEASGLRATDCIPCLPRVEKGDVSEALESRNAAILRLEKHLKSRRIKLLSWESAIRGGIDTSTSVVAWHETQEGVRASEMGYEVIMAPSSYFSFDYYQSNPTTGAEAMSGFLPLEKVYSYNPIDTSLDAEISDRITGVQANMWTYYASTAESVETMLYPRLLALSEVAWSNPASKSYINFKRRALQSLDKLQEKGYVIFDLRMEQAIRSESEQALTSIAKHKPVTYYSMFDQRFPASGKLALTDGERGGWAYNDGRWQGFQNMDLDVVIDLEKKQLVKCIAATFIYDFSGNIHLPYHIEILGSNEGNSYTLIGGIANEFDINKRGYDLVPLEWNGNTETRYVRFIAKYSGNANGWMFTDEIIIE